MKRKFFQQFGVILVV